MLSVVVSVDEFSACVSLKSVDHNSEIDTLRYIYEWVLPSARPVDEIRCVPWYYFSESKMNPNMVFPVYKVFKQRT